MSATATNKEGSKLVGKQAAEKKAQDLYHLDPSEAKKIEEVAEAWEPSSEEVVVSEDRTAGASIAKVAEQVAFSVMSSEEGPMKKKEEPQFIPGVGIKGFDPSRINDPDFRDQLEQELNIASERILAKLDPKSVEAGILRGDVALSKPPKLAM